MNWVSTNGKKVVIPDPETGPIIKRMFERYTAGNVSLEEVGLLAMEEGLPLKREGNFRAVVQYMFKNCFYYGDFIYKKKLYKGIHEGLVSRECWDKVQEVRAARNANKRRKPKERKSFAFARMISCGHCGCSLVGELKKGKYIYYHCTHYRGKCDEPYVREEVLEEKFTEILRTLHFDDEVLDWMRRALRESQADEQRYREEAVQRLQRDYNKLQKRIDTMYIDKLDGRIDAAFFDQKQSEWREEQGRLMDSIAEHQKANESYIAEGIMLMELANRAADLFEKQPASEKRRLLDFVLSNSSWANGELSVEFRQPFGMIADMAAVGATEKVVGTAPDDLCLERLTVQDSNSRKALSIHDFRNWGARVVTKRVVYGEGRRRQQSEDHEEQDGVLFVHGLRFLMLLTDCDARLHRKPAETAGTASAGASPCNVILVVFTSFSVSSRTGRETLILIHPFNHLPDHEFLSLVPGQGGWGLAAIHRFESVSGVCDFDKFHVSAFRLRLLIEVFGKFNRDRGIGVAMHQKDWGTGHFQMLVGADQIADFLSTQAVRWFEHHFAFRLAP